MRACGWLACLSTAGAPPKAAAEVATALAGTPRSVVAFYAHLFAGRAASTLGRRVEAANHYQRALALFPDAQSALLASSRLALAESDVRAALQPIERLGLRSAEPEADPWWQSYLCAGREADDLLRAVWDAHTARRRGRWDGAMRCSLEP